MGSYSMRVQICSFDSRGYWLPRASPAERACAARRCCCGPMPSPASDRSRCMDAAQRRRSSSRSERSRLTYRPSARCSCHPAEWSRWWRPAGAGPRRIPTPQARQQGWCRRAAGSARLRAARLPALLLCVAARDIGAWDAVFNVLGFLGVITNATLVTFVGKQLAAGGPLGEEALGGLDARLENWRLWCVATCCTHSACPFYL